MEQPTLTPSALKDAVGISQAYASMILTGERTLKLPLAIEIFRKTGHKLGPIAEASDEDIDTLERFPMGVKLDRQERAA
jgi:hypothetical protein